MRVNVYAEEMTDRIEVIAKEIEEQQFTGLRFYLELPVTVAGKQYRGPFIHRPGDDDSGAITFWGKRDLRVALRKALGLLDAHYDGIEAPAASTRPAIGKMKRQCFHKKPVGNSTFFCVEPEGHQCPHFYSVTMDNLMREFDRAEKAEAERDALRAELKSLLECSERYIFGDECIAERDAARAAIEQENAS